MFEVSIGICVFNEEKNIRNLLKALLDQKTKHNIKEIIVISSACSDNTERIIEKEFLTSNSKIILLKQKTREGKASAINLFLEHAKSEIVVLESGDTIPAPDTIENLIEAFNDPKVGMTGGHPIPMNREDTFVGFSVHLLWNLHHKLALKRPKMGELVAFRRSLIKKIPIDTAVDEAAIESLMKEQGYELKYVPDALLYNRGSETIDDFIKQRRRIYAGHIHLAKTKGYMPSSMKKMELMTLLFEELKSNPGRIVWTFGAALLEITGRLLGSYDFYVKKENPYIWNIATTTKWVIPPQAYEAGNSEIPMVHRTIMWSQIRQNIEIPSQTQMRPDVFLLHKSPAPRTPVNIDHFKSSNKEFK